MSYSWNKYGTSGFFQEISPDDFRQFISDYEKGAYSIQRLSTVSAEVKTYDGQSNSHLGLNEIVIKRKTVIRCTSLHMHRRQTDRKNSAETVSL